EFYDEVRSWDKDRKSYREMDPVSRAARFLFLNKTCFNGVWRVNSRGEFNVPYASPKHVHVDGANLLACSELLKYVDLRCASFDEVLQEATLTDFVYLDPPYLKTFSGYTQEGFGLAEHTLLRDTCRDLAKRGVRFLLSN